MAALRYEKLASATMTSVQKNTPNWQAGLAGPFGVSSS
jgi:hypothetical protein